MMIRTNEMTRGERRLIVRRRAGRSQREMAELHDVSLYFYRKMERDPRKGPPPDLLGGPLGAHERLFLLRRRAGLAVRDVAERMGVSPWWVTQMERGTAPVDRLAAWWAERRDGRCRGAGAA